MPKHGKRYRSNLEKVDREHHYPPAEAVRIIKDFEPTKFDETVEVHIRTGLNVRHADQQLRGTISLPHGLGKEMTVAVFAKGDRRARPRRRGRTSSAPRISPSASRKRASPTSTWRLRRRT